ncbi:hypothetical protein QYF36_027106 [Acer negundo]|nr:hypothetical protein QYF36_027106 [Acer negundo]
MSQTLQVVIVPSPGMGHLIPFIEFAKHLVHFHDYFNVTCIIPAIGSPPDAMKASLLALPPNINHIFLPPIIFEEDQYNYSEVGNEVLIFLAMTRSLPSLRHILKSLIETNTRVVAFLVDFFGTAAFDVANEFNLSSYLFFTSNAMALSTGFYLPKLDRMVSREYRDLPELVKIPGCVPVHGRDIGEPFQDRKSDTYKLFLNIMRRFGLTKGIILNTFIDIEAGALKALMEEEEEYSGEVRPPIYPIGPLIRAGSREQKMNAVMLNKDVKVALRPKVHKEDDGSVIREEIAIVVKELMEGEEGKKVHKRMREILKDAALKALMEDGASRKALLKLALE